MQSNGEEVRGGRNDKGNDKGKQRIRGGEEPIESTSDGTAVFCMHNERPCESKVPSEEYFGLLGILFHLAAPSAA